MTRSSFSTLNLTSNQPGPFSADMSFFTVVFFEFPFNHSLMMADITFLLALSDHKLSSFLAWNTKEMFVMLSKFSSYLQAQLFLWQVSPDLCSVSEQTFDYLFELCYSYRFRHTRRPNCLQRNHLYIYFKENHLYISVQFLLQCLIYFVCAGSLILKMEFECLALEQRAARNLSCGR